MGDDATPSSQAKATSRRARSAASADETRANNSKGPRAGLTRKAEATRRTILDAALKLFAEQGFHRTTVPHIAEAAGVGHGTFYQYFQNRRDVLIELTEDARAKASARARIAPQTVEERIRLEVLWYLTSYVDDLNVFKVWEEAAVFDREIGEQRRRQREARVARVERGIAAISTRDDIDRRVAAVALNAMLEGFAYRWFVLGDGDGVSPGDVFAAAHTLAAMWISAVGADATTVVER